MRANQREDRGMVESGRCPVTRRVTHRAIGREARRYVGRIRGPGEILLMAAVTGRGQCRVIVIRVAARAGYGGVCARKRETRVVVIERRRSPCRRVMACGAGRGEAGSDVIGVRGSCVVGFVA